MGAMTDRTRAVPAEQPDASRPRPWLLRRWRLVVAALVVALGAVAVVAGAYYAGRMFTDRVTGVDITAEEPSDGLVLGESAGDDELQPTVDGKERYDGPLVRARVAEVTATCQAPDSADAAGNPVSYEPENAYDGRLVTAWRCVGDGAGERLVLALDGKVALGEVGLVPGYAKTDRRSGVDRYAQNRRITEVTWWLGKGRNVTQRFDGSPGDRDLRTLAIPRTRTKQVAIEIVSSTRGERNTVAVSEVWLGRATR